MSIKNSPDLHAFLSTYFPDADPEADESSVQAFFSASTPERQQSVILQTQSVLESDELSTEELGIETNRWFADSDEAKDWLRRLLVLLKKNESGGDDMSVTDVNGVPLTEGDSVQVIKDLKVKGGASDLKRGTLVKKIHLIGDPQAIECRVEGSTLILKTCFLKKV